MEQHRPVLVGHAFRITAAVGPVARKESRGGGVLDFITVVVDVGDRGDPAAGPVGRVTEGFVIKRGA